MNINDQMSIDSDINLIDRFDKTYSKLKCGILAMLGFICLQLVAIGVLGYYTHKYHEESQSWDSCSRSMKQWTQSSATSLDYMPRCGWDAATPKERVVNLDLPVQYVVMSHTEMNKCYTNDDCCEESRSVQSFGFDTGIADIAYNFMVGNDGVVYVGRGWEKESAAVYGYNADSIVIAFMGDYSTQGTPTDVALDAAKSFLQVLVNEGVVIKNFTLHGLCQLRDFPHAPGDEVYPIIKTWHGEGPIDNTWSWREANQTYCAVDNL